MHVLQITSILMQAINFSLRYRHGILIFCYVAQTNCPCLPISARIPGKLKMNKPLYPDDFRCKAPTNPKSHPESRFIFGMLSQRPGYGVASQ
jgi:hypothetical protein